MSHDFEISYRLSMLLATETHAANVGSDLLKLVQRPSIAGQIATVAILGLSRPVNIVYEKLSKP